MVSTGADEGTMKPEALSEEGGLLLEPLLVVESDEAIATSRGCDPRVCRLCATRLRDACG